MASKYIYLLYPTNDSLLPQIDDPLHVFSLAFLFFSRQEKKRRERKPTTLCLLYYITSNIRSVWVSKSPPLHISISPCLPVTFCLLTKSRYGIFLACLLVFFTAMCPFFLILRLFCCICSTLVTLGNSIMLVAIENMFLSV